MKSWMYQQRSAGGRPSAPSRTTGPISRSTPLDYEAMTAFAVNDGVPPALAGLTKSAYKDNEEYAVIGDGHRSDGDRRDVRRPVGGGPVSEGCRWCGVSHLHRGAPARAGSEVVRLPRAEHSSSPTGCRCPLAPTSGSRDRWPTGSGSWTPCGSATTSSSSTG